MGGEEGPKSEGTPVPVAVGEGDHRFWVLGLVAEDLFDTASEFLGDFGERQSGLSVGLDRGRASEESVMAAHQASSPESSP